MNRSFLIAGVLTGLVDSVCGVPAGAALYDDNVSPEVAASAKDLFYQTAGGVAGPVALAMRYQIILRRSCVTRTVPDVFPFESGDLIRLYVESNRDGYLYVLHRGSSGRWRLLSTDPGSPDGALAIRAHEERVLPASGWFEFDRQAGTEELFLFLSPEPIREFQAARGEQTSGGVSVTESEVSTVVARHREEVRRGSAKDIRWEDDAAADDTRPAAPRDGMPTVAERGREDEFAGYAACVSRFPTAAMRSLSLAHVR